MEGQAMNRDIQDRISPYLDNILEVDPEENSGFFVQNAMSNIRSAMAIRDEHDENQPEATDQRDRYRKICDIEILTTVFRAVVKELPVSQEQGSKLIDGIFRIANEREVDLVELRMNILASLGINPLAPGAAAQAVPMLPSEPIWGSPQTPISHENNIIQIQGFNVRVHDYQGWEYN